MWFLSAIPVIGKLFDFGNNVTNAIRDLQLSKVQAQSEKEKAQIQERIDQLQAIASVQSGNDVNRHYRFWGFGFPSAAILWKYIVWDKVLGAYVGCTGKLDEAGLQACSMWRTDGLSPEMWYAVTAAITFYLLTNRK